MLASQNPINEWISLSKVDDSDKVFSITATSKVKVQGVIKWPVQTAAVTHEYARYNITQENEIPLKE